MDAVSNFHYDFCFNKCAKIASGFTIAFLVTAVATAILSCAYGKHLSDLANHALEYTSETTDIATLLCMVGAVYASATRVQDAPAPPPSQDRLLAAAKQLVDTLSKDEAIYLDSQLVENKEIEMQRYQTILALLKKLNNLFSDQLKLYIRAATLKETSPSELPPPRQAPAPKDLAPAPKDLAPAPRRSTPVAPSPPQPATTTEDHTAAHKAIKNAQCDAVLELLPPQVTALKELVDPMIKTDDVPNHLTTYATTHKIALNEVLDNLKKIMANPNIVDDQIPAVAHWKRYYQDIIAQMIVALPPPLSPVSVEAKLEAPARSKS